MAVSARRLGPESTLLVHVVNLRLRAAQHALATAASEVTVDVVGRALTETDKLLAALVGCDEVDDRCAQQIAQVRDDLGGSLLAAAALHEVELPALDVLRHAIATAESRMQEVLVGV